MRRAAITLHNGVADFHHFPHCSISVPAEVTDALKKLGKPYKYIIFKISDDQKTIEVEDASEEQDWESFREKLFKATFTKKVGVALPTRRRPHLGGTRNLADA
ncbi:hypothetical protein UVI_02001060 [Ustilaginoidea virens]|uniref:ADF-H domain-containing protein n=1 Tax=Ustilaginoidea virens TaxID=1159556 RepID=A0A1B5KTI9_USTVR|nr:hypothetical protein UVI_02001060 [Ustilaginoidea virens]